MDLNLFATFAAVAEMRSFAAAARKLKLPRSSVSRAVARLEEITGARLFQRTTRHVALSSAGTALYDRVLPSLQGLQSAVSQIPEAEAQPAGELRVTAPVDPGGFLAEACVRFAARFPHVQVELTLTNRLVDLVAEGFDLGLRMGPGPLKDSSLVARKLMPIRGGLFASPVYLARHGTPRVPSDLNDHEWVVFQAGPKRFVLSDKVEVVPHGRIRSDSLAFCQAAMRADGGVGFLPLWLAEPDVATGALVPVLPGYGRVSGNLFAIYPAARHVPLKVTAFRDLLLEVLKGRQT